MKTLKIILLTTIFVNTAMAQDIVIKTDSSKVIAAILEVYPTEIKYKMFNYLDGPTISVLKSDIAYIIYRNGVTEKFIKPVDTSVKFEDYNPNKYNLDNVPVTMYDGMGVRERRCQKLYKYKNFVGFNYIAFLNTALGFNYMRDIKKANLIINVPFAFGVGSPAITSSLYGRNYTDGNRETKYDFLNYQVGMSVMFAPSMTREVNFLMGPSFNFNEYKMSVDKRYTSINATQNQFNNENFKNKFNLYRQHYGVNIGFLARFSDKINMSMLLTFGFKKDTYSEKDPYGFEFINANAKYAVQVPENIMPYVNYAWSVGYRF